MIDIHTHILPGLDDGADDWDETMNLARAAVSEGISTLIATPHHANGKYTNYAKDVLESVRQANERLTAAGLQLTVLAGQEIRVHDGLLDAWQREELLSLGGSKYVLLEMPFSGIPPQIDELIYELRLMHLRPIIAHPERNAEAVRNPERLAELIEAGAYAQVTAGSLLGAFGRKVEKASWTLCKNGLIHIVSSDAHHSVHRGFNVRNAYGAIRQRLGESWESYYLTNAQCVADNEEFGIRPPFRSFAKTPLSRLFAYFNRD